MEGTLFLAEKGDARMHDHHHYIGPLSFVIPEPMPEPEQCEGCKMPEVIECGDLCICRCYWDVGSKAVGACAIHCTSKDKRTAILAHNAAVRVLRGET